MPVSYNINSSSQDSSYEENDEKVSYSIARAGDEVKPDALSVSDALLIAKTGLESIRVKVIGEVSELSNKPGYKAVYFSIKDKKSVLPCLMWKNKYDAYGIDLELGSLVEISGKFSLYAPKGRMNFDVDSISLAGEGELRMQVARIAKKLQAEGLTDPKRKQAIDKFPNRIGLVTSPRGAVVHDVIRTLNRRMPTVKIVFAGVAVEGVDAPNLMINALDLVDSSNVDVIILCRGGGSFEDLMPFNDEDLARKIASLNTPIVTGIGHEPDTTIADLVSDLRASTPTAAAESVSINLSEQIKVYLQKFINIQNSMINRLKISEDKINSLASRPIFADPRQIYSGEFQSLDYLQEKLSFGLANLTKENLQNYTYYKDKIISLLKLSTNSFDNQIKLSAAKLNDKSPLVVLSRGYSVTRNSQNKLVKSIRQVQVGDKIDVEVSDGIIDCNVNFVKEK